MWRWALRNLFFTQHCGSKDLYHVYISKKCHSAVVARIFMYGERVRYFIETELWQQISAKRQ